MKVSKQNKTMSSIALEMLQECTKQNNLDTINLSSDGKIISFQETSVDATIKCTVLNKVYSLASFFLLCKNSQSLARYHKECAEYSIQDMVKAYDRSKVFKFFDMEKKETVEQYRPIPTKNTLNLVEPEDFKKRLNRVVIDLIYALENVTGFEFKVDEVLYDKVIPFEIELGSVQCKKNL